MNTVEELRACLALQNEIDEKTLELRKRFKAVIDEQRAQGNEYSVSVELDGHIYLLEREDNIARQHREVMEAAHKLGGFYFYRLIKTAKHIS